MNFWTVKNGMLGPVCRTEEVSKRNAIHQLHLIEQFCSGYLLYGEPGTGKSKGGHPSLLSLVVDYPILGSKLQDFLDFKCIVKLMASKSHLTPEGLNEIKKIKSRMNSLR